MLLSTDSSENQKDTRENFILSIWLNPDARISDQSGWHRLPDTVWLLIFPGVGRRNLWSGGRGGQTVRWEQLSVRNGCAEKSADNLGVGNLLPHTISCAGPREGRPGCGCSRMVIYVGGIKRSDGRVLLDRIKKGYGRIQATGDGH